MTLFPIYDLAEAQATILKRRPPDEFDVTESLLDGIERIFGERLTPDQTVRRIIADVREQGDTALYEWTRRIDGVEMDSLIVSSAEIERASEQIDADVMQAMELAARRIEDFHQRQPVSSWIHSTPQGTLGQLITSIERVGVYVPGGTAPLPSTLLMSAIPAKVAGVNEIVVATPPKEGGRIPPVILAAAHVAGVDHVIRLGGVMAVAALAYGTETIRPVLKIVGPGNLFVSLAKRQVYGTVGIDGIYGPTETMVIADSTADPALIAGDLLAQAEHDVLASAILVTPDRDLAEATAREVESRVRDLSRADILRESLPHRGGVVIVADLSEAFAVANEYAVEHLQLSVANPMSWLGRVKNAGALFLGEHSFEVLGDYVAGPSHSLPTGGTARFASGLNVLDFVKLTAVIGLEPEAAADLSAPAAALAHAEQLTAHAAAAEARRNPHD
ncbi:MAG: histidinol dehydrogenase [Chloroflexi bacterium]|nr:histidinol dehydrogenase [Chloroflexota bacterium]